MPEERRISPAVAIIPIGLGLGLIGVLAAMAWAAAPTIYTCPYCPAQFSTEAELLAHIELEHPEVPPVEEPHLISIHLPSVPSGAEFWPEATLYLPLQDYQDYGYGFSLDVDESLLEGDIYYTNIMAWGFVPIGSPRLRADGSGPLPLSNPTNIYTVSGTRFAHPWTTRPSKARYAIRVPSYWGYRTQIVPIPPGSYPMLGSILLSEYIYTRYPYGTPKRVTRGSWDLGVVGTLEVI